MRVVALSKILMIIKLIVRFFFESMHLFFVAKNAMVYSAVNVD